jgi:ABC-2 type transport system permease protein
MHKIGILLQKEWLEFKQQRALLLGIVVLPLFLTSIPLISLFAIGTSPSSGNNDQFTRELIRTNPALAGMSQQEAGQAILGQAFSAMFLLMPMILPSIIAAYSIVGEKTNRTLEPLLATPVETWELLTGKILAALIPTVAISWLFGAIFIGGMAAVSVSQRVFAAIVSPGWLTVFLLCTPLLGVIAIAAMVAISARVNDPRTAQQLSAWVVLPFLLFFFGQLTGLIVLGLLAALGAALALGLVAVAAVWAATRLFQREVILTKWT